MASGFESGVVISGIGQSDVGRRLRRDPLDLTLDAALAAIGDAGLSRDEIDGVATYPGMMGADVAFSGPTTDAVIDALRLRVDWFDAGFEGPGQLKAIFNAAMAVGHGLARHVLVYRTVTEGSAQGEGGRAGTLMSHFSGGDRKVLTGAVQWMFPYGAYSPANWFALYAQRHFHEFGTTREQLAGFVLNDRKNAAHNDKAIYRTTLTLDDYLSARRVTSPFCIYDCDVPCDGSTAFIVSDARYRSDTPNGAVGIEAIGTAVHGRTSYDQWEDMTTMMARDAAAHLWSRTDLRCGDVDFAQLYDGFSFFALAWLEALGFCERGEAGPFVDGGDRISLGGELPLNTGGGQLSGGRLHGFGLLYEACLQLRGEAGPRQLARRDVGLVALGGGPLFCGCVLLTRPG